MSRFAYPVDTDQFQIIRENGMLYVDKTDMMWELADRYSYVFLARPRRFGNSLLCNTFKAYFQGQKELFDGLNVMELEKEWKKYPVFHFTMSGLKNCTVEEAKASYRQAKEIPCTVSVLDQIALSALGTSFLRLFALHMKNNCITFVFLSCTFKAI